MDFGITKLLPILKSPVAWLHALVSDQTHLLLTGEDSPDNPTVQKDQLLIQVNASAEGFLRFALSTKSNDKVEIKEINFDYSALAQFSDPANMGFFSKSKSSNASTNFPFRLSWSGSIFMRKKQIHTFAIFVEAPKLNHQQLVCIEIHAQKHSTGYGGFPSVGRVQVVSFTKAIVCTDKKIAFELKPGASMTSAQPFIVQGGMSALTIPGTTGNILVHEELENGKVSSREINL